MKYWFSFLILLSVLQALGQSDYERAVRLFEEASTIYIQENNSKEINEDRSKMAIELFEDSKNLFMSIDSSYYQFRCDVGIMKLQNLLNNLKLQDISNLKKDLIGAGISDSLLAQVYYHEGVLLWSSYKFDESGKAFEKALPIFKEAKGLRQCVMISRH